jgi:hypothetical protein
MSSKYLNELFYHDESDFSFDKIEPFFFTIEMKNSMKPAIPPSICHIEDFVPPSAAMPLPLAPPPTMVLSPPLAPPPTMVLPPFSSGGQTFEPNRPDKLFWAIFIHVHGIEEYNSIGHSYGNRALEEKTKIASHIKKNAALFKTTSNYKITNIMIQEIQSELMTMHSETSHIEMLAMAFFYEIEIAVCLQNNTYMTFGKQITQSKEIDPLCIIYTKGKSVKLDMNPCVSRLTPLFKHHHYLKPLNTISHYKTEELCEIQARLGMPPLKSKKQDIYNGIIEYLTK